MLISIVIIVGAASGVIVFNSILVTWCLFCQRRQKLKQTIALQKRSSLPKGKRVKFAASVKGSHASYPAPRKGPPPNVLFPPASAKARTRRSDRPRAENLFPQKFSTMPTMIHYAPSVCSDDTASVYSTASAPLENHDHLLRSHKPPNIIPVTSVYNSSDMLTMAITSPRDADLMLPPWSRNRLSVMEEGLGPKTYNRVLQQLPRQALSADH